MSCLDVLSLPTPAVTSACSATGAVSADPLDDLDAMLDSATPQRQQSAREALASGEPLAVVDRACWCRGGESWLVEFHLKPWPAASSCT